MTKKTAPKKTAKKISKSTPVKPAKKASKSKALPKAKTARKVAVKKSVRRQIVKTTNKKSLKQTRKPTQAKKTTPKKVAQAKKTKTEKTAKTKASSVSKKQKSIVVKKKAEKKPAAKSTQKAQRIPAKKMPITKQKQKTTKKHSDLKKLRASVNAKAAPKKITAAKKTQKAVVKSTKTKVKKIEISKKQPSKPAKKTAGKPKSKTENIKPVKPTKVSKTKQPKTVENPPKAKAQNKKPSPVVVQKSEETPVVMHKVKTQHLRPSHNIYFSIEDLYAFFERKDNNLNQSQREKMTAKVKSAPVAAKPVVTPIVPKQPLAVATVFDILGLNPVVAQTHEKLEEKDVPRKWKKYYNMLVDLRKHHSTGVEQRSEEVLKRSAKEDAGDLSSYGQHLADAGSESFERDMAYNLISNQKEILAEIEEAIKRIKNGTYGICEVTGKPIPESRLASIPYTRCTKEGQEIKEREAKRIKASQRSSLYDMGDASASGSSSDANSDEESGS